MTYQGASFLLSAALLCTLLCIVSAAAKKDKTMTCWACSSSTKDDPCVDGKQLNSSINTETCTGPEAVCIKVYSHVYGISEGDSDWDVFPPVVSRFCAKEHPLREIGCAATEGIKGKQVTCLCDDEDKCNSGNQALVSLFTIALTVVLARFL